MEKHPAISQQTLQSAIEDLKSQYDSDQRIKYAIPEAVYLNSLPDYDEFFSKFLVPNQLCLLSESGTRHWRSRNEWVCEDGSPNFDFLQKSFGEATVPVANCKCKEFSAHTKQEQPMREFLAYWRRLREAEHPTDEESLYLKDWHFTRAFPSYQAYSTCSFFRSDWMNEFWDERDDLEDDYRFVYMGPKGTWTPLHADVFRSFSWSANICGRKKWIFFPPGEEEKLKDVHGTLVYDVTSEELKDPSRFPNAHTVQHRIEIVQNPGETIFVPSGWHHQVHNLEDTISINHNWLNGCNVRQSWLHLKAALAAVEEEISDCRDMEGWDQQCQRVLRAFTGMDYGEFFRFMESIARHRIKALSLWKEQSVKAESCVGAHSKASAAQSDERQEKNVGCGNDDSKKIDNKSEMQFVSKSVREETTRLPNHSKKTQTDFPEKRTEKLRHDNYVSHDLHETQQDNLLETQQDDLRKTHQGDLRKTHQGDLRKTHQEDLHETQQEDLRKTQQDALYETQKDELREALLDLTQTSRSLRARSPPGPHWGVCNVHHALFDLTSVALVLLDMAQTTPLVSAALLSHGQKDDRSTDSAQKGSDNIQQSGDGAQQSSNFAKQDSNNAQQSSNCAKQDSDSAQQSSNGAQQSVNSAQQSGNCAKQDSNSAQQSTNGTQQSDNSAQQSSNSAKHDSNSAQQCSNCVKQNSNSAQQSSNCVMQSSGSAQQSSNSTKQSKGCVQQSNSSAQQGGDSVHQSSNNAQQSSNNVQSRNSAQQNKDCVQQSSNRDQDMVQCEHDGSGQAMDFDSVLAEICQTLVEYGIVNI